MQENIVELVLQNHNLNFATTRHIHSFTNYVKDWCVGKKNNLLFNWANKYQQLFE